MYKATLFDLPTVPAGVMSLSLPTVAACLADRFAVRIVDLNLERLRLGGATPDLRADLFGLKVCAQNLPFAIELSQELRRACPDAKIVWGGEYPSLRPEVCSAHADSVVAGAFEPLAAAFVADFEGPGLAARYVAPAEWDVDLFRVPRLDLIERPERYLRFMGQPLETSRGCEKGCTFCLKHVMQPTVLYRKLDSIREDLRCNPRRFVNVVDYNPCGDRAHLLGVAEAIGQSSARGWMVELSTEKLLDDQLLDALRASRCRIVYCGIESLSQESLRSIGKRHNQIDQYGRAIRNAQRFGIEVAAGVVVGLDGQAPGSLIQTREWLEEHGALYAKLTFLTYNPGTPAHARLASAGLLSGDDTRFDGNHLTYRPNGLESVALLSELRDFIRGFTRLGSSWRRSRHLRGRPLQRVFFVLFANCFGRAYRAWLRDDGLAAGVEPAPVLSAGRFRRGAWLRAVEWVLRALHLQ